MRYTLVFLIVGIKLASAQSESTTFQSVDRNAAVVGIEPFYNETTFSITECYLVCQRQLERCSLVEIANVNEAWSCKLFRVNTTEDITKYLKPSKTSGVSRPKLTKLKPNIPKDCKELKTRGFKDGVYSIALQENMAKKVFCDMTTDGGGWIVIQKRFDGSVDFNRDWKSYKDGFGNANGEYWIGNEFIHQFTDSGSTEMIAEARAFDGRRISVKLHNIRVGSEAMKYNLQYDSCTALTDGPNGCFNWDNQRGSKFTTFDNDNDNDSSKNCAVKYPGGWWFNICFKVFLNGRYSMTSNSISNSQHIHWSTFLGYDESLKETKMLLRKTVV